MHDEYHSYTFTFPQPSDITKKVWQYITLEQLISILHYQKLHLTRLDFFADKHEGSIPTINQQLQAWDSH